MPLVELSGGEVLLEFHRWRSPLRYAQWVADLSLDLAGVLGTAVLRLGDVVDVRLPEAGNRDPLAGLSTSRSTTWHPAKIAFEASYGDRARLSGFDFFVDSDATLIRVLRIQGGEKRELVLGGKVRGDKGARWGRGGASPRR